MYICDPRIQRGQVIQYLGTKHAVRDFEDFRVAAGYAKANAVGTSYGTAVVQVYCALFQCKTLVIDSPLNTLTDATLDVRRDSAGRRDTLERIAELCAANPIV